MQFSGKRQIQDALQRLNAKMVYAELEPLELISCGGASLNLLGLVSRSTTDVDILCAVEVESSGAVRPIKIAVIPEKFRELVAEVGNEIGLEETWLNFGPAPLMDFGLPPGLESRLQKISFGTALTLHVISRLDQIHLKLYAVMDPKTRVETHLADLLELAPNEAEVRHAVQWLLNRKTSSEFRSRLKQVLDRIGHEQIAETI